MENTVKKWKGNNKKGICWPVSPSFNEYKNTKSLSPLEPLRHKSSNSENKASNL